MSKRNSRIHTEKNQKKAVDEYVEAFKDANRITTIDSYMVGFRLRAKIALDILDDERGQLIPLELLSPFSSYKGKFP